MKVRDLLDPIELTEMIEGGYIRVRNHPTIEGLRIYNYSEKAAYESVWNNSTLTCRGLIADRDNNILARPFPKFFNYGQTGAAEIALEETVYATDKMDGSLGILYPDDSQVTGYAIATRGSFESDQAIHATRVLNEKYPDFNFRGNEGITLLFEIVYAENRIVLDYGDMDDLVLLGICQIQTGSILNVHFVSDWVWTGPRTGYLGKLTFAEVLAIPPRANAEGIVISTWDNRMLKIKQEDYIALHRIVTGLSEKTVWEALSNGTYEDLLEKVPDEFHAWLRATERKFGEQFADEQNEVHNYCHLVSESLPLNYERKEFALAVVALVPGEYRSYMFAIEDGKLIDDMIWKRIKPVGATPMKITSEDTA